MGRPEIAAPQTPNGSVPDGCVAAHVALERADHALSEVAHLRETDRRWYALVAGIKREIAGLDAKVATGFAQFGVRLQTAEQNAGKAAEEVDELEDTLVRDLRAQLAKAHEGADKWKWWLLGLIATVVAGVITAGIIAAFTHK